MQRAEPEEPKSKPGEVHSYGGVPTLLGALIDDVKHSFTSSPVITVLVVLIVSLALVIPIVRLWQLS